MILLNIRPVIFVILIILSLVSQVSAVCRPYKPAPAFLEQLEKGEISRILPDAKPLSSDQKEKLRALVRSKSPDRIGELAQLEGFWRAFSAPLLPFPVSGPPPLTIVIRPSQYPVQDPVKSEFDADGDGKPEWVRDSRETGVSGEYTYREVGDYKFVLRVYDSQGEVHTYGNPIKVLSPAEFDSRMQAIWDGLKDLLRQGDIPAALECIHTQSRARYNKAFLAISDLSQTVDQILTTVRIVNHRTGQATYEMIRPDAKTGSLLSYEVRFNIDVDGEWRIESF